MLPHPSASCPCILSSPGCVCYWPSPQRLCRTTAKHVLPNNKGVRGGSQIEGREGAHEGIRMRTQHASSSHRLEHIHVVRQSMKRISCITTVGNHQYGADNVPTNASNLIRLVLRLLPKPPSHGLPVIKFKLSSLRLPHPEPYLMLCRIGM